MNEDSAIKNFNGVNEKFLKPYDPKATEKAIYEKWENSGYFNPDNLPERHQEPFTIIMPPPNANGDLHAGHALFITLEDIMTRYKRMQGYKALWIPGADHAGFETQVVYEKKLEKEGRSRFGMDPNDLYKEILNFTLENKTNMEAQVRSLGASCDWEREKFTLDKDVVEKTQDTFIKMFNEGMIYRGKRTVNWCSKHQTSLSEVETESGEEVSSFYYLKYGPFEIGTVRPETKFGDKYVVMHPDDKRYSDYEHGQKINIEWINGPIEATIIKDPVVDMEFGTGVMTITPWHSQIDFELAKKYNLDVEQIIDWRGKLLPVAQEFAGMNIKEARGKIVEKLKEKNLLLRIDEKYQNVIKKCYKCNTIIEPQIKEQWFVKMEPLAKMALQSVDKGEIKFIPDNYEKIFRYWMTNTIDWNISRQIVWGIPIPAWSCLVCKSFEIGAKVKSQWFIVRHGETEKNKDQITQGHTDSPLTPQGRKQALDAAEKLKNKDVALIISSDLGRCKETAEIISKNIGAPVEFDSAYRERYYGDSEGMTYDEVNKKFGKPRGYDDKIGSAETFKEVEERVWNAFAKHKDLHGHKNIIIVSHGGAMRMLIKRIKNLSPKESMTRKVIANADVISLDVLQKPCSHCNNDLFERDPDTFDTWFSSGQWPLFTTGFPNEKDFSTFYPTDVMETGHDLIFKWVPRMVIFGLYLSGKAPFHTVYLHGLVNDAKGKKMSKSKGNVINPLALTEKYGTDALRLALIVGNTPGTDLALQEDKVKGYKHFANKLWNITRFVLDNTKDVSFDSKPVLSAQLLEAERLLNTLVEEVTADLEEYRFYLAGEKLYHYIWHTFADIIIESAKKDLLSGTEEKKLEAKWFLHHALKTSLKLLHPFMPFITEEIWQSLPYQKNNSLLLIEEWPVSSDNSL